MRHTCFCYLDSLYLLSLSGLEPGQLMHMWGMAAQYFVDDFALSSGVL